MTAFRSAPTWHGLFLVRVGLGLFLAENGSRFGNNLQSVASRPEALFHAPVMEALHLPFPPPLIDLWGPLIGLLGWMITLGIRWRLSAVAAAGVTAYVGSCISGFGYFNHGTIVIPQMLLVLTVSPGADACSLDRLARSLWRRARDGTDGASLFRDWMGPATPPWGIHLAGGILALMYIAAGVSKLRYAPLDWLRGDTLRIYLTDMNQQYWLGPSSYVPSLLVDPPMWAFSYISLPTNLGRTIAATPALCAFFAVVTLVVELIVPLGLVSTVPLRAASCVALFGFHLAISKTMSIPFHSWMVLIVALFPWPELFRAVHGLVRANFSAAGTAS